jgi:hypothetical protein
VELPGEPEKIKEEIKSRAKVLLKRAVEILRKKKQK